MKVARIQHSLKDLNKDIGNCERQLSKVLRDSHSESTRTRSQNVASRNSNNKPVSLQASFSHLTRNGTSNGFKLTNGNQKIPKSRPPNKTSPIDQERNVIRREIIGDKYAPTRVEVVVRTESCRKRSRSAQGNRTEHEIPTKDYSSKNKSIKQREFQSTTHGRKSTSWGHILQQQNSSSADANRTRQGREKVCAALHYSSTDDDNSSAELEKWMRSIPQENSKISHKSSRKMAVGGNVKTSDVRDNYSSTFNPLRTLNFLIKELRGKVHKNYDENMQRIIDDMEKALCCIPMDSQLPLQDSNPAAQSSQLHKNYSRLKSSVGNGYEVEQTVSRDRIKTPTQEQQVTGTNSSSNLVNRLMCTVSRITKITGLAEQETQESNQFGGKDKRQDINAPSIDIAASGLQAQLELGCKQLEETCLQMEETCENLRQQKNQLLEELKCKTQQLDTVVGKNQQLTVYAADIRQEMCHIQQAADKVQQDHEKVKQKLLLQQHEMQQSNQRLNQRLEETIQENERLSTELQLSHLEKDKMHILMSNKDLEVAKLKKEIVDINTLVTEQLSNLRSLSGKKCSVDKLDKMMEAVCRLHDTVDDSANNTFMPDELGGKQGYKNHIGDGEGSRTRPICSSPTSSLNSSLYSSWHLMSDITATDQNCEDGREKERPEGRAAELPVEIMSKRDKDSGINTDTPIDILHQVDHATPRTSDSNNARRGEKSANELKAGLQDMLNVLKKQSSEVVNVTLPSPPRGYDRMKETLSVSQWTELSASESTVLFQSSDDSDSDDSS